MEKIIRHYKQKHLRGTMWTRIANTRGRKGAEEALFSKEEESYEK
jgi:hypothetical protein